MVYHLPGSCHAWHQRADLFSVPDNSSLTPTWTPRPLDTFQRFPDLPPEIRSIIWKYALINESTSRVVFLDGFSYRLADPSHLVSPYLSVDRQSRGEAAAYYELEVEVRRLPRIVHNPPAPPPPPREIRRRQLDEIMARTGQAEEAVGAVRVSATRDIFMLVAQKYNSARRAWVLPPGERLFSAPLAEADVRRVRRLARAWADHPVPAHPEPGVGGGAQQQQQHHEVCRPVRQAYVAETVLEDARSGWVSANMPGLEHYGVLWIDQTVPAKSRQRQFVRDVRRDGTKGAHLFRRFVTRVEEEGSMGWNLEVEEDFTDIRPLPVETFELESKDMVGLVGSI